MKAFDTFVSLEVVDKTGKPVFENNEAQVRLVKSPAWAKFFPNRKVYVVQVEGVPDDKLSAEFFLKPISIGGKVHRICRMWGSGVKEKRLFAVPDDMYPYLAMGWKVKAADGYRGGRALMSNAIYGAGEGEITLQFQPMGWRLDDTDHYVHDGHGLMRESFAKRIRFEGQKPIVLGDMNDSFQLTQVFTWEENKGWIVPFVAARLHKLQGDALEFAKLAMCDEDAKLRLLEADPETMLQHPYLNYTLTRRARELAARLTTTIPFGSVYKIAVPGPVFSESGLKMVHRFPIQMNGNVRIVDNGNDPEALRLNKAVAQWEVVQYTITSKEMSLKGDFTIVPDHLMPEGVDAIPCSADVKMKNHDIRIKDGESITLRDAYLGIVSWWGKGSAVMVPYDLIGKMQGDFDGDGLGITPVTQEIADYVTSLPEQPVSKLPKNAVEYSDEACADMIYRSCLSSKLVGLGSNLRTTYTGVTVSQEHRDRVSFMFGEPDPEKLEKRIGTIITFGTDGFKADVDVKTWLDSYNALQSAWGQRMFGVTKWKHDENVWGKFYPTVNGEQPWDVDMHTFQGTVAQIFKMTVDTVTQMIKARGHAASLSPAEFIEWAEPQQDLAEWAADKVQKYNLVARRVAPHTKTGRESLTAWCVAARIKWAAEQPKHTQWQIANAIWRAAHTKTNNSTSTSAAFTLYPEEALRIVATKPGITDARKEADAILIGLPRSVGEKNMQREYRNVPVRIVQVVRKGSSTSIKQAAMIALEWPTDLAKAEDLPEGTLGLLTPEKPMPAEGEYVVTLTRIGEQRAYAVALA